MRIFTKKHLKKVIVYLCVYSIFSSSIWAHIEPIEYDVARQTVFIRSHLNEMHSRDLEEKIRNGIINSLINYGQVSLPISLLSRLVRVENYDKGILAIDADQDDCVLPQTFNEGLFRIKGQRNLSVSSNIFINKGEFDLIDNRTLADKQGLPSLEWQLNFQRIENEGAILGDVSLTLQGIDHGISELGGFIAARNVFLTDVRDLRAFVYVGYGTSGTPTIANEGNFVYRYTIDNSAEKEIKSDPTSVVIDEDYLRPIVRGAIFAKGEASFNYTYRKGTEPSDGIFLPIIAPYLNVEGVRIVTDSDQLTQVLFAREDVREDYGDEELEIVKMLLSDTTFSHLRSMWPRLRFNTRAKSSIGNGGLSFDFKNVTGAVCIAGQHAVEGEVTAQKVSTFEVAEQAEVLYGRDSNLDAEKLLVKGHFLSSLEDDFTETESTLTTSGQIKIGKYGVLRANVLNYGDSLVGHSKVVHTNLGTLYVHTLNQKIDTLFYLENHGRANLRTIQGGDYILHIVNNSGSVSSSSQLYLRYKKEYLEGLSKDHGDKDGDYPLPVIEGYVKTDHKKGMAIVLEANESSAPLIWKQSLLSKAGGINLESLQPIIINDDTKLRALRRIKLDIPGMTLSPTAEVWSQESVRLFSKTRTNHILNGRIGGNALSIEGNKISGSGILDARTIIFKFNNLETKDFKWGDDLRALYIYCDRYFELEGGNIETTQTGISSSKKSFDLKDKLVVGGKGSASLNTSIKAKNGVAVVLNGNSKQRLTIDSDSITSDSGPISLIAPNAGFHQTKPQQIEGTNVYISSNGGTESPELTLSSHLVLGTIGENGLIEIIHDKRLNLNGSSVRSDKLRLVSGSDLVGNSDKIAVNKLYVNAKKGRTDFLKKIKTKSLCIITETLMPYNIEADVAQINAEFADISAILFECSDARLEIVNLRSHKTIMRGNFHLKGDDHDIRNLEASEADIQFSAEQTAIKDSKVKTANFKSPKTTIEGDLRVELMTLPEDAQHISIFAYIITNQKKLKSQARKLQFEGKLARLDGSSLEELSLVGLEGYIHLESHADKISLLFYDCLNLSCSLLISKKITAKSSIVVAKGLSLKAEEALVVGRDKVSITNSKLEGENHVITTASSAHEANDVEAAFESSHDEKTLSGHVDLTGTTMSVVKAGIFSGEATFDPQSIKSQETHVSLQKFGEGGLSDALHLAHSLVNSDAVTVDARRLQEPLIFKKHEFWRRNLTMEVPEVKFLPGSSLTGQGKLGIHAVRGISGNKTAIRSCEVELTTEENDIDFTRSRIEATESNSKLEATSGGVHLSGSISSAAKDQKITPGGEDVTVTSLVDRSGDSNNFSDHKILAGVSAGGALDITAARNIAFTSADTKSGTGTTLHAGGHILDFAVDLVTQSLYTYADGYSRTKFTHASVSNHVSDGEFTSIAASGMQHLFAPKIKAKKVYIYGEDGIRVYEVHDSCEYESHTKTDDGFLGGKSETHIQGAYSNSKGASIESEHVTFESRKDIELTNIHVQAPKTIMRSMEGVVKLLLGTNYSVHSMTEKSSDAFWQEQGYRTEQHNTFTQSSFSGSVEIDAQKGALIQAVQGKAIEYIERITMSNGQLSYEFLEELHKVEEDHQEGPTAALAIVVAIAASICTAGAGAAIGASVAGSMGMTTTATVAGVTTTTLTATGTITAGMVGAGFSSLCSQAAVALVASKGDIGKAAKSLANSSTLKNIGISMAAAGFMAGAADKMGGVDASKIKDFGDHALHQTNRVASSIGANALFGERSDVQASVVGAIVGTLAAYASNNVGEAYRKGSTTLPEHLGLHAAIGGASGAIMGRGDVRSIAAGAIGSAGAELYAEIAMPTGGIDTLPQAQRPNYTSQDMQRTHNAARFVVALGNFSMGMDAKHINIADTTANTALIHNHGTSKYLGAEGTEPDEDDQEQNEREVIKTAYLGSKTSSSTQDPQLRNSRKSHYGQSTRADERDGSSDQYLGVNFKADARAHNQMQQYLSGRRQRSLSFTSETNYQELLRAETEWNNAQNGGFLDRWCATWGLVNARETFDERVEFSQGNRQTAAAVQYTVDHPLHTAAYLTGGALIAGSMAIGIGSGGTGLLPAAGMGAAGSVLIEYANKDFTVKDRNSALDLGAAGLLGAIPGAKLRYMLPAAALVGGVGCLTDQTHLKWESGLVAGLGITPRVIGLGAKVANSVATRLTTRQMAALDLAETGGFASFANPREVSKAASKMQHQTPNITVIDGGYIQSEIQGITNLKSSVAKHGTEADAWKVSRESRADGLKKLQENPKSAKRRIDTIGKLKSSERMESARISTNPDHTQRLVARPNENPHQFTSDIFNPERLAWTAPSGTKQTYKVTQRTDIDWSLIRTEGPDSLKGITNLEAGYKGASPQLSDGSFATLHHLVQDGKGKLVEASTRYHGGGKYGQSALHSSYGVNKGHPTNPVNRSRFAQDDTAYWKYRAKEANNG